MKLALTEQAADKLGDIFTSYIKKKIKERIYPYGNPEVKGTGNKFASGKLYNSISYEVVPEGEDSFVIEFTYLNYFDYVNRGRKKSAGKVPLQAILDWISIRRIKPSGYKGRGRYAIKDKRSLAFAIQQNIFKYGIRPANIIDKTYDSLETFFAQPPAALARELEGVFESIQGDINNLIENIINNPQPQ
jgi:hypothetical protein